MTGEDERETTVEHERELEEARIEAREEHDEEKRKETLTDLHTRNIDELFRRLNELENAVTSLPNRLEREAVAEGQNLEPEVVVPEEPAEEKAPEKRRKHWLRSVF